MTETGRDAIFISHANPEDNAFTVWLGARQPRGRQEAVNGPTGRVRVLGHGREDLPGDASDVARLEMLGKHCRHDPVARFAADGVLGPAEDGMRAEERRRDEPGHGNLPNTW